MRRQAQWLEARVARLAAALAQDPRDPDPPLLCEPMRFVFYRRFGPQGLRPVDSGDGGPVAANLQQQQQQRQQALLHGQGGGSVGRGRPEREAVESRVDKVADHILGLRQLPEESRHRRLKLHQFNRHMNRLSGWFGGSQGYTCPAFPCCRASQCLPFPRVAGTQQAGCLQLPCGQLYGD